MKKNSKMFKFNLILLVFFLVLIFGFSGKISKASCQWGDNCSAERLKESLEEIYDTIQNTLLGAEKEMAVEEITEAINDEIAEGDDGSPMFVTNWEDFLKNEPEDKTDLYMNDFYSSVTNGRGGMDYSGYADNFGFAKGKTNAENKVAGSSIFEGVIAGNSMGSGNYQKLLINEAKKLTTNASIPTCNITNASDMFKGSNWSQFTTIIGVDTCNKFGFNNISQSVYSSRFEIEKKIAEIQGIAYKGYKAKTVGGFVVTPGSTVEAIKAQSEDLGNKILAGANSVPEVITALVSKLDKKTLQEGIGSAQSYIQRTKNLKSNNYLNQINASNIMDRFKSTY